MPSTRRRSRATRPQTAPTARPRSTRRPRRTRTHEPNQRTSSRSRSQKGGDASPCAHDTNYAPYNYDSFYRWRGNSGDSVPVTGATVPMNAGQRFYNWFNGKSTLFTPTAFDSTSQHKVQYQSQNAQMPAQAFPSLSEVQAQRPGMNGKLQSYSPFKTISDDIGMRVSQLTPMARAGGRKRRRVVRRRRRTRK